MASQVFYRKWRPQTFSQVVGQGHVTTTLRHAVASGRVAHAYLFAGPRGTGKTSTGRILAKAVNCLSPQDGDPCDRCAMCQAVSEGRALDLVEIDAASHRGIEEARDLREKVRFAPYEGKYKVYIIDEVHMLTDQAFNALLKTLEEPPPYVIFVMATTEPHRVLATILSRCQRFDFRRIAEADVVQRLAQLCQQEGLELEPAGLKLIARSAGGSLRDAENLLEQLAVGYGTRLSSQQVAEVLGTTTDERSREVARLLLRQELPQALALLNQAHEEGVDLRQFHRGFLEYLRGVMLLKAGAEGAVAQESAVLAEMKALAQAIPMEMVVRAVKAAAGVSLSPEEPSPLPLELALAEVATYEGIQPWEQEAINRALEFAVAEVVRDEEASPGGPRPLAPQWPPMRRPAAPGTSLPAPERSRAVAPSAPPAASSAPQPLRPEAEVPAPASPPPQPRQVGVPLGAGPLEVIRAQWKQVTEAVRGKGRGVVALDVLLRSSSGPLRLEDDTLVLGFASANLDKMEKTLEDPPTREALEEALSQVAGRPLKVACIAMLKEKKAPREAASPRPGGHMVREAEALGARPTQRVPEKEKP